MFGRKKKAQEQAAAEQQLEKFDKLMNEAKRIEDAGEKLFRLEELKADIQAVMGQKALDTVARANKKWNRVYISGIAIQIPVVTGIAFAAGVASLMGVLTIPATIGTFLIANKASKKEEKRLQQENAFFLDNLKMLEKLASVLADNVLDEHLDAIAKSTKRDLIFDKFPDVKTRFGAAAAKKMFGSDVMPKPEQNNDGPKV